MSPNKVHLSFLLVKKKMGISLTATCFASSCRRDKASSLVEEVGRSWGAQFLSRLKKIPEVYLSNRRAGHLTCCGTSFSWKQKFIAISFICIFFTYICEFCLFLYTWLRNSWRAFRRSIVGKATEEKKRKKAVPNAVSLWHC